MRARTISQHFAANMLMTLKARWYTTGQPCTSTQNLLCYLHLGLLAKRAGDLKTARHELEQASVLLPREDASRILLLGGGFSREALINLSQAQLNASGGPS